MGRICVRVHGRFGMARKWILRESGFCRDFICAICIRIGRALWMAAIRADAPAHHEHGFICAI